MRGWVMGLVLSTIEAISAISRSIATMIAATSLSGTGKRSRKI
jgi:hypothetical protein